ncbi:MAG TPA: choice-of-anchor L domain-containing protein [Bacteroidales bacterium]|nr:choice-of-anchor L domain-containing protein [Bacteroidales bacterium]
MKKKSIFIIGLICTVVLSVCSQQTARAQLTVVEGAGLNMTPLQLVQQVLVGSGVTVSNATFNSSAASISSNAIGSYTAAAVAGTQLGFSGGILLTSGQASLAIGPNTNSGAGFNTNLTADPDLQLLVSTTVYDKAVLEFDFVPISDTIRFRYVFGSEEFDEFCASSYNDVFGFFISGPGITGPFTGNAKNIAVMPNNPANYVTINNICTAGATYSWLNSSGTYFQYDRMTYVYTAWSLVTPCQTYHIKLAVGDAGDHILDSGVFLEANSFSSNGVSYNTSFSSQVDTVAVEGCNDAIVTFHLGQPDVIPTVINYSVSGTAVEGVDYPNVPDSLIIPAGQDSAYFVIHPIADGLAEPGETVIISYVNTVCGTLDTIMILINDYTPLYTISITPEVKNCGGQAANISITAGGGYTTAAHGLLYEWSSGAGNTAGVVVDPATPTMYYVTVSDACYFFNDSASYYIVDSVMVSISDLQNTITNVDSVTCFGYSDGSATVTATSGLEPYHYLWSPTNDTTTTANNLAAGTYFVTITDNIGCTSGNFVILNDPPEIGLLLTPTDETCLAFCNGSIATQVNGNYSQPVSWAWSTSPTQNTPNATNLCSGTYTVTFTYSNHDCFVVESADIITGTPITADFTATPDSGFVPLTVQFTYTGIGATDFYWDFGDGTSSTASNPQHTYTDKGLYIATLSVSSGPPNFCEATQQVDIKVIHPSSMLVPNIFTPNEDGHNDIFQIESQGINTLEIAIFNRWGKKIFNGSYTEFSTSLVKTDIWDGTSKSEGKCADGTYYYILDAVGDDLKEYHLQGTISLMR